MQSKYLVVLAVLVAAAVAAPIGGFVTYSLARKSVARLPSTSLRVHELYIVDGSGKERIHLAASAGTPTLRLLDSLGQQCLMLSVDDQGYSAIHLSNPAASGPIAALEIDDKGAHVKFDRPGAASSYLFLNNSGGSGVVLVDAMGHRKLDVMVTSSGETSIRRYDAPSPTAP